jgi:hypothetical protein
MPGLNFESFINLSRGMECLSLSRPFSKHRPPGLWQQSSRRDQALEDWECLVSELHDRALRCAGSWPVLRMVCGLDSSSSATAAQALHKSSATLQFGDHLDPGRSLPDHGVHCRCRSVIRRDIEVSPRILTNRSSAIRARLHHLEMSSRLRPAWRPSHACSREFRLMLPSHAPQ